MDETYDLRSFFSALGGAVGRRSGLADEDRSDTAADVEVLEDGPSPVRAAPLDVRGYVDGVQASACVAYVEHRPVHLVYTGAACIGPRLQTVAVRERLVVVCAEADAGAMEGISAGVPVQALAADDPVRLESMVRATVDSMRERCEQDVVDEVAGDLPVVVDGDLRARGSRAGLVGVAKTLRTRYLPDESSLFSLPHRWRSPMFKVSDGASADRYSCYLRLLDARDQAWSFGLVRLEAFDRAHLEPLAALCLTQSQGARSGDRRFDVHLAPVRACEELLRARRPAAFSHL